MFPVADTYRAISFQFAVALGSRQSATRTLATTVNSFLTVLNNDFDQLSSPAHGRGGHKSLALRRLVAVFVGFGRGQHGRVEREP
jgi:hypothetical protein